MFPVSRPLADLESPADAHAPPTAFSRAIALGASLIIAGIIASASATGMFRTIDDHLTTFRAQLLNRPLTGSTATVEIDSQSLKAVGIWPWPRSIHAELLDRLMALGARQVVFDIDFSAESDSVGDGAFAAALGRAGGAAALAAFEQPSGAEGGPVANLPIQPFAQEAAVAAVDVPLDSDNVVRRYDLFRPVGGRLIPTVGTLLAGRAAGAQPEFGLNLSIDVARLDRISAASILEGTVDLERVRGKDVIIGASAQELRDFFFLPRFGLVSGATIHALAAETLKQGVAPATWPKWATFSISFAMALFATAIVTGRFKTYEARAALVGVALIEAVAFLAQAKSFVMPETAGLDLLALGYAATAGLSDLRLRRQLHRQAARQRDIVQAMLTTVVADNFDGVVVLDDRGSIIAASRFADELIGPKLEGADGAKVLPEGLARPLVQAFEGMERGSKRKVVQGECSLVSRDGRTHLVEYVVTVSMVDPGPGRRVGCLTLRDVTQRREAEARLAYVAAHDELTGTLLRGELLKAMAERLRDRRPMTVVRVDLRRFETVNEVFGHAAGDEVLRIAARRLEAEGFSMVSRVSGDGFVVVQEEALETESLEDLGRHLLGRLKEPYKVGGDMIVVGAAAGATTTAISGFDAETLLIHAGVAQASVKRGTGADFVAFAAVHETQRREKQEMDRALRAALGTEEISLAYQPKVDLRTGAIAGAEALARWRRPDGSLIAPDKFIPVAEESGFVVELGRWAIRRACFDAVRWPAPLRVAVNVSPIQFAATDVAREIEAALQESGLSPDRLEIELTEGVFVDDAIRVSDVLRRLRAQGVTVAIDDFGTGYSSLRYLGRLPIDVVKIDKSFVDGIPSDDKAVATVGAILSLAATYGKAVVAEGVETKEQAEALRVAGCRYGQGYLFGAAVPSERLERITVLRTPSEPAIVAS